MQTDLRYFTSRLVIFMAVWFVFVGLDPLGFEHATRMTSAAFLQRVSEPFYGLNGAPARKKIAVVEVTDQTLAILDHRWPLSFRVVDFLLDNVIQGKPRAIFVDLRFTGNRGGQTLDELDDAIARAKHRNIPILFANGQGHDGYQPLPTKKLQKRSAIVEWNAGRGIYPLQVDCPNRNACERTDETAAFAIFHAVCIRDRTLKCQHDLGPARLHPRMAVRWGNRPSPDQILVSGKSAITGCQRFGASPFDRLAQALKDALRSVLWRVSGATCPYELTIDASVLNDRIAKSLPPTPIDTLLAGRVVFFGADLLGEHDVVRVPGIGQIAGVQAQAMAFDNLLTFRSHYFSQAPDLPNIYTVKFPTISRLDVAEVVIWFILSANYLFFRLEAMEAGEVGNDYVRVKQFKMIRDIHRRVRHHPSIRIIIPAVVAGLMVVCFILDLFARNLLAEPVHMVWIVELATIYAAIYAVFFVCLKWRKSFRENVFCRGLALLTVIIPALFINEFFLQWQGSDWVGLILLWSLLPEFSELILGKETNDDEQMEKPPPGVVPPGGRSGATISPGPGARAAGDKVGDLIGGEFQ